MKTSLRKLGRFALHRHVEATEQRYLRSLSQLDELAQASQDLEDMRDCYDTLLAAAAATTNSAYEFSESLREMGSCLLEKTALNEDEESGKVLLMLGKIQFELQKLLDRYRSNISRTITIPSQSLLNELRRVEEMKRQCDEKRSLYEYMVTNYREKGRSKAGKGENFSIQQLQDAREQYDEAATLFVFRLKSLKQGQSRSLLTQAARHYTAQLHLVRNCLSSLEAAEPHVSLVTKEQHIDFQFDDDDGNEIEDDDDDDDDESRYGQSYVGHDDGELSFDYGRNGQDQVDKATLRHSMELDQVDLTFPNVATTETVKENLDTNRREFFTSNQDTKTYAQSAPLFAGKKSSDIADRLPPLRQTSIRKLQTYVLPTPGEPKSPVSARPVEPLTSTPKASTNMQYQMVWHSSPLEPQKYGKKSADEKYVGALHSNTPPLLKESNKKSAPNILPPPLAEGLLFSQFDPMETSGWKKFKRQAYSGPLAKKPDTSPPLPEHPQLHSGPMLRNPIPQQLSPSPISSSPHTSSPKISELHELPRPPASSSGLSGRPPGLVGHSAPLVSRGAQDSPVKKSENMVPGSASPLPRPPSMSRSFSIPSSGGRVTASGALQEPQNVETSGDISSPPLTPISLPVNRG